MPICNINEFLIEGFFINKVMGIDIGKKRWGIALSDPHNSFSLPHKVLYNNVNVYGDLNEIIENYNVNLIVVGLPLNFDNSLNKKCQSIRDMTKHLDKKLSEFKKNLPILFWDESFSTQQANDYVITQNISKRKKIIDKFAASIILQDFLDFLEKNN